MDGMFYTGPVLPHCSLYVKGINVLIPLLTFTKVSEMERFVN